MLFEETLFEEMLSKGFHLQLLVRLIFWVNSLLLPPSHQNTERIYRGN